MISMLPSLEPEQPDAPHDTAMLSVPEPLVSGAVQETRVPSSPEKALASWLKTWVPPEFRTAHRTSAKSLLALGSPHAARTRIETQSSRRMGDRLERTPIRV